MNRTTSGDAKGKAERQQTILRLIQEHPISRQEVLLEHLREEALLSRRLPSPGISGSFAWSKQPPVMATATFPATMRV